MHELANQTRLDQLQLIATRPSVAVVYFKPLVRLLVATLLKYLKTTQKLVATSYNWFFLLILYTRTTPTPTSCNDSLPTNTYYTQTQELLHILDDVANKTH